MLEFNSLWIQWSRDDIYLHYRCKATFLQMNHSCFRVKTRMWAESDREIIEDIMDKCYIGDWFVLHLLSRNTNLQIYKRIVKSLANVLRERKSSVSNQVQRYSMERLEVANGVWSLVFFLSCGLFLVLNVYGILKNSKNYSKLDCIMMSELFFEKS